MDEVNQEIHFFISHFLYHCFYKNGNLIKYMLLLLSLRFCLIIDNGLQLAAVRWHRCLLATYVQKIKLNDWRSSIILLWISFSFQGIPSIKANLLIALIPRSFNSNEIEPVIFICAKAVV